jgi:hypothetical protein
MRAISLLALCGLLWACDKPKRPEVYDLQIASCDDEIHKAEQMRSVSGHDDEHDLQAKKDAVALSEYFLERCFPNPYSPPDADQPQSGTVGEIIDYQRKVHNRKYPYNPI